MSGDEQLKTSDQELMSGGDMLARALKDEGVEVIFGYPGGAVLHIYDALFRSNDIPHVLVRHEQAATHAADGYTRATGKIPAVLVTSGPGATNAITGIATAFMDSIAMVVIAGQVPSHLIGEDAFQETDMMGVSRPIVKHSFQVRDPADIPEIIKKAFYIAGSGRPGPVVVDIPKDMTAPGKTYPYSYPAAIEMRSYNPTKRGHSKQIKKAAQVLTRAKKPMIYAGGGVIQGDACTQLVALAQALNFPVTNTLMGLGAYPATDRQFVGMLGMHGFYEANMAMHNSDVILAVGARFDDRITNTVSKFCPDATIIHIDIDPASISKTVAADIPIVGSAAVILEELLALCEQEKQVDGAYATAEISNWWKEIDAWRDAHGLWHGTRYQAKNDGVILPQQVIETLYKVTDGDAYVTSDVGQHQMFAAQYYRFDKPRRWINSGGLGTMGFGLPAAMGAKLAFRDADVACVTGEGSIQMNIQELSTCSHYNLPVKIININNQALGMVKQWQDMQYAGRHSESTYSDSLPDFVKLAEAYGHVGMRVERLEDLEPMMRECFALKDKLVFMDICVDPEEHVYPMMIAPDGDMSDMYLSKSERS